MSTNYPSVYQQLPPQPPPIPPHIGWPRRHKILTAIASGFGLIVALIIVIVATSTPSITKTNTPTPRLTAPASAAPPAPTPASSLSGPLGTVYQATDGSGNVMTVKLTRVIDPAQGADQFTTPNNGFRFVGAVFALTGVSGTSSDDANNDAALVGSNGQSYTPDFSSIAGYTNFNNGLYSLTPGVRSVGAVTFQVPLGVTVASVQWSASGGFGGAPAVWVVTDAGSSVSAAGSKPWAIVSAYYQDITARRYHAAWRLLAFSPQGGGYGSFVAGYAGTGRQTVTEISASGDRVTFTLKSQNTDGTVQTYQGTDTVTGGMISAANVVQTS